MKKGLLFALVGGVSMMSFAQGTYTKVSTKAPKPIAIENVAEATTSNGNQVSEPVTTMVGDRSVSIIPIGSSGNVYSVLGNGRTYVWADPTLNSVVFTHRMVNTADTYGTSRVAFDVSNEGGAVDTWSNNIHVYDPTGPGGSYPDAAGRYPQGGILNPVGNTNPADAYYTYFATTLDGSNGDSWGGYAYGTNGLTNVDPANPTQHNVASSGEALRLIPKAFTVTQQGVSWMVDESTDMTTEEYTGKLIVNKGTLTADGDVEYEEFLIDALEQADGINDIKVAFAPDGQIGYILVMSEPANSTFTYTNYHPILFETTDGGATWASTGNHCELGGATGLAEVKEFVADDVLDELYGAGWNRDEIPYNMGFHADLAVDANGNAYVTGLVTCATDDGSWYPTGDASGTFNLKYDREAAAWEADFLYMNKTFEGELGDVSMYNRPQVGTDKNGEFMFFSWIDTDIEEETANINPDIYVMAYDVNNDAYSEVMVATQFTEAMYSAFFATMSHYVFSEVNTAEGTITLTVPFVYAHMNDPQDPTAEVQYKYIDGVEFVFAHVGVQNNAEMISNVKQNYPNPVSTSTTIEVEIEKAADLSIEVSNLVGQVVYAENRGTVGQGTETFVINAENYKSGVYFYTVRTNNTLVTKKMIVE